LAGAINGLVGRAAVSVRARRVAEMLPQIRQHRFDNRGIERRCGIVVEVNYSHRKDCPTKSKAKIKKAQSREGQRPRRLRLTRRGSYRHRSPKETIRAP